MASEPGRLLVLLARAGIFIKGVLYMVVGWLAASAAFGEGGRLTGSEGALVSVLRQPYGRVLLLVAALGLFGYAFWRVTQGIVDPDGDGTSAKGLTLRASYVVRGLVHAVLGWQALRVQRGLSVASGGESDAAGVLFALPFGEWMLGLVGLGLIGYAGFEAWRAWSCRLPGDLDTRQLRAEAGDWAVSVSRFGLAARAIVFAVIGSTAIQAGLSGRASEMEGTEGALRILSRQQGDAGQWILAVVGLGLIAYGFYQLVHSRYLRIRKPT
jgi:hypothetical protein